MYDWVIKWRFYILAVTGVSATLMFFSNIGTERVTQRDMEEVILGWYEREVVRGGGYRANIVMSSIITNQTAIEVGIYTNNGSNVPYFPSYGTYITIGNEIYPPDYSTNCVVTYTPYWGFPTTSGTTNGSWTLMLSKPGVATNVNLNGYDWPSYGGDKFSPVMLQFSVEGNLGWTAEDYLHGTNLQAKLVVIRTTDNTNLMPYTVFVFDSYTSGSEYDAPFKRIYGTYNIYAPRPLVQYTSFPYQMMANDEVIKKWVNQVDYASVTNAIFNQKDAWFYWINQIITYINGTYEGYSSISPLYTAYTPSITSGVNWASQSNYAESCGLYVGSNAYGYYGTWHGLGYKPAVVTTNQMYYGTFIGYNSWYSEERGSTITYGTPVITNNEYIFYAKCDSYYTYFSSEPLVTNTVYSPFPTTWWYISGVTTTYEDCPYLYRSYYYTTADGTYTNINVKIYFMTSSIQEKTYASIAVNMPVEVVTTNAEYMSQGYYGWPNSEGRITKELLRDLYKYLRGLKYLPKDLSGQLAFSRSGGYAGYNYYFPTEALWAEYVVTAESNYNHTAESAASMYNFTPGASYHMSWQPGPRSYHYAYVSINRRRMEYLYDWAGANYSVLDTTNVELKVHTIARLWKSSGESNAVMDDNNDYPNYVSTGTWFVVSETPYSFSGGGGMGNWVFQTNRMYCTNLAVGNTLTMPNKCQTPNQPTNVYPQYQARGYYAEVKGVVEPKFTYCIDETLFTNSP